MIKNNRDKNWYIKHISSRKNYIKYYLDRNIYKDEQDVLEDINNTITIIKQTTKNINE